MNAAMIRKGFSRNYFCFQSHLIPIYSCIEFRKLISTSSAVYGKRNFRKFLYFDRGTPQDQKWFEENPEEVDLRGMRLPGYYKNKKFVHVPEMVPEIVVPDLTGFKLKPYVSYRTKDVVQEKFTPEHLFYAVYAKKIKKDWEEENLDEQGNPLKPSKEEKMTAEEAWCKARASGSDLFG